MPVISNKYGHSFVKSEVSIPLIMWMCNEWRRWPSSNSQYLWCHRIFLCTSSLTLVVHVSGIQVFHQVVAALVASLYIHSLLFLGGVSSPSLVLIACLFKWSEVLPLLMLSTLLIICFVSESYPLPMISPLQSFLQSHWCVSSQVLGVLLRLHWQSGMSFQVSHFLLVAALFPAFWWPQMASSSKEFQN